MQGLSKTRKRLKLFGCLDISRGVPLPTMEVVFQEMFVFADKEQLVNASTYGDKD